MTDKDESEEPPKREREEETKEEAAEEPPAKQQKLVDEEEGNIGDAGESKDDNKDKQEPTSEKAEESTEKETPAEEAPSGSDPDATPANSVAPAPQAEPPVDAASAAPPIRAHSDPRTSGPQPYPSSGGPPSLPYSYPESNPDAIVEERSTVSALYVGRVIGKGGEMIRDLQARSSCRIDVDQNVPQGQPRVITYRGTRRTVDFAKRLVQMLCQENASETDLPLGDARREYLYVPAQSVGKIIGRGGEMIRELQARSQAKIQVDHNSHQGMDGQKHVTMTGTDIAVTKAKEMIQFLVANPNMDAMQSINMLIEDKLHRGGVWGSGPPYINLPNMGQDMQDSAAGGYGHEQPPYYGGGQLAAAPQPYAVAPVPYASAAPPAYQQAAHSPYGQYGAGAGGGGVDTEIFYAAKNFMGRIIGSKGATINDLQRKSACDIQINQDVPPGRECEITIRGTRQGIEMVKQMLVEIIEIGPNHPYAGGGAPPGGGYQQIGYDQPVGQYGYPNHAQGGYNQGYGQGFGAYNQNYQAPAPLYGQPYPPYQAAPAPYSQSPAPGLPPMSEWKSATSPDGQVYYYNERTGQTQWDKPVGMP